MEYWGYHTILDVGGCNHSKITDKENIYNFVKDLVKQIDMVPYGEPQIVKFGSGEKAGYTLIQLIETSNISAHFVDESNAAYIDVFSCKPYDVVTVFDLVEKYFEPTSVRPIILTRQASV